MKLEDKIKYHKTKMEYYEDRYLLHLDRYEFLKEKTPKKRQIGFKINKPKNKNYGNKKS